MGGKGDGMAALCWVSLTTPPTARASGSARRAADRRRPVPDPWVGVDGGRRVEQRLHDSPGLLDAVLAGEAGAVAEHGGVQQHLVGGRPLAALVGELHVERDGLRALGRGPACVRTSRTPVDGSSLTTSWLGSGGLSPTSPNPSRGGLLNMRRTSVWVIGRCLPVRMKNGTPDQRQLSMSSRRAA